MNLSLRNRVATSFIIANMVILVLGFIVFHFLDNMHKEIEKIVAETKQIAFLTIDVRHKLLPLLKKEKRLHSQGESVETINTLISACEDLTLPLQELETIFQGAEGNKVIIQMIHSVNNLKGLLVQLLNNPRKSGLLEEISDFSDKVFDSVFDFQTVHSTAAADRDEKIKGVIVSTKKNMMYTLIITFIGTMLLGLVVPGKIALPFKKINDAIRELQECNFDVSIYYYQNDEIGEIASEMNKMIASFKRFEELRADRIILESRKFDALANMVHKHILVANAKGELIYMNNRLYSLLQVQSDDIIYKNMKDTRIPQAVIETFLLAIKRRSKIENVEIVITQKKGEFEEAEGSSEVGEVVEEIFRGYSNVIPIRGKDSSLDYYLMIMSEEVFV